MYKRVERYLLYLAGCLVFAVVIMCAYILEDRFNIPEGYPFIEMITQLIVIVFMLIMMNKYGSEKADVSLQDLILTATPLVLVIISQLVWAKAPAGFLRNITLFASCVTTGFSEELFFRVLGVRLMTKGNKRLSWVSVVVLILGFSLAHIPGVMLRGLEATLIQIGVAISIGALLLGVYLNTKSWLLISVSHSLFNYLCNVSRINSAVSICILPVTLAYILLGTGLLLSTIIGLYLLNGHIKHSNK